jgi:DNA-binding transcriptional regulator LsrR (DeoR family)
MSIPKQIANRLYLPHPNVSQLIEQARQEGIVQINVASNGSFFDLEKRYGLEETSVVDADAAAGHQVLRRFPLLLQPAKRLGMIGGSRCVAAAFFLL